MSIQPNTPGSPILEAVELRKTFSVQGGRFGTHQTLHAVEPLSLVLLPGKALALVGESGSGKTTVARLLARLYPPTGGAIYFRGKPVGQSEGLGSRAYSRQVQLLFQDPFSSLNPLHTVRYMLGRPLSIFGHVHTARQKREHILELLARVNLTPAPQFIDKYPHELSGGQRQRVAIARALAARPTVLLADEPISMLDVSIRLDILNLLQRLKQEDRLAMLYITHDIASARYFAEETLVMYAGQPVEGGPSDTVIRDPQHPYTQLLVSSVPNPKRLTVRNSLPTAGEPPSLIHPPTGCRFSLRCPHAMPICKERFPTRTALGNGRWVHCHLHGDGNAASLSTDLGSL